MSTSCLVPSHTKSCYSPVTAVTTRNDSCEQPCDGAWVAMLVRGGFEQRVAASLDRRGYEKYLPVYRDRHVRPARDRILFPGYVFCRYTSRPRFRIVEIPGVIRLLGTGRSPTPIPEVEIQAIVRVIASGYRPEPRSFLQTGHRVVVTRGPLEGMIGILLDIRKETRFVISLPLLQRSVAVEVAVNDVASYAP